MDVKCHFYVTDNVSSTVLTEEVLKYSNEMQRHKSVSDKDFGGDSNTYKDHQWSSQNERLGNLDLHIMDH